MTLDNIIKYAEKIGINEISKNDKFNGYAGSRYKRETWINNYFYNTEVKKTGVLFDFRYDQNAGNVKQLKKQADMIKKYAARYGFTVFFAGQNLTGFYFAIMPADDKRQLNIIDFFTEESIKECDILIHNYHVCGIYDTLHKQLNNELYNIMSRWEQAYLDYIKDHKQENTNNNIILFVA